MDVYAIGTLLIRVANALVWTVVVYRIVKRQRPVTTLTRLLISQMVLVGFWLLALGGFTPFGLNGMFLRLLYTGYTAGTLIVGFVLMSEHGKV